MILCVRILGLTAHASCTARPQKLINYYHSLDNNLFWGLGVHNIVLRDHSLNDHEEQSHKINKIMIHCGDTQLVRIIIMNNRPKSTKGLVELEQLLHVSSYHSCMSLGRWNDNSCTHAHTQDKPHSQASMRKSQKGLRIIKCWYKNYCIGFSNQLPRYKGSSWYHKPLNTRMFMTLKSLRSLLLFTTSLCTIIIIWAALILY